MSQPEKNSRGEVLFLVSPSFGLLDNWLPVFWELKQRRPDARIIALIPKPETVLEIDPADATIQLGESVFDEVIFKSRAGAWAQADRLTHARQAMDRSKFLNRMLGKARTALKLKDSHALIRSLRERASAICFDVFATTKQECRAVLAQFPETPRFSIPHGLGVVDFAIRGGSDGLAPGGRRRTAYLFSKREIPAGKRNYGLADAEMKVTGVPRHDPRWISAVLERSPNDIPPSWDRYVFVISRPVVAGFFPREEKRRALEHIRKLAREELRAKVVVRFHPTERREREGLYEEVFGEASYGTDWMYSAAHPFAIGSRCLFGIAFYSGVAIDLLALGVPTVQVCDFAGGGKMGTIMDYKAKGLVLGAGSYDELKQQARRMLGERASVMRELMPSYREFFAPRGTPVGAIADDICAVI